MVRHDCETCGRERAAVLRGGSYVCLGCSSEVNAGDTVTPEEQLTRDDWDALGKTSSYPEDEEE